jgi:hypothetical protein
MVIFILTEETFGQKIGLIRNCSDAPFSLENDVRAVFHHRGGERGGKGGGWLFLFPSNIPM